MSQHSTDSKQYTLLDIPLFSEFEISDLQKISEFSRIRKYGKHQNIFLAGDDYTGFYILLKGKVKVYKISPEGKESIVHILKPLDMFAEIPLFEQLATYPVCAQTLEECKLFYIPKDGFLQFIDEYPQIYFKIISGFAKKLRSMTERIENLTLNEVSKRLAKYIMSEYDSSPNTSALTPYITLAITKSVLANYLGTITETLSRTFKKLNKDGLIQVEGKKIKILDLPGLLNLSK